MKLLLRNNNPGQDGNGTIRAALTAPAFSRIAGRALELVDQNSAGWNRLALWLPPPLRDPRVSEFRQANAGLC